MKATSMRGLVAAVLIAGFTGAQANGEVVITGGGKGGNYDRWANNVARLMKGLGYEPKVLRSKGSAANVDRVKAGEAHIGFTQGDALMAAGPGGAEILAELGKECVFLVGLDGGNVTDEDHLQSKDPARTIGVGKRGSGSQVTWAYMGKLEEGYRNAAAEYIGGTRALGKVGAGQLDAAMFVTSPDNLEHRLIAAVNANSKLEFIDVDDSDLNDKLPSGQPVYTFEDIDTYDGIGGGIDTICTPVLAIANEDADEDLLDDLANILLTNKAGVLK